jgi:hypothetical protein
MKRNLLLLSVFFYCIILVSNNSLAQCPYGTPSIVATVSAPTTVATTITSPTMTSGQVYRVTGMVAGAVYMIYDCTSGFDTQITMYSQGGGTIEGYNDDLGPECSSNAASISYTCIAAGTKDIKLSHYYCQISGTVGTIKVRLLSAFPIELLYFTGHAEATANIIEWATATEKNNQYQIVERSSNGIDSWTEVGRKAGAGNSTTPIAYKLTDAAPLSLCYYRLRAIDFDGTEQLSEIISIQRESDVFTIVNAFPVPVDKEVTLLVNTPVSGDVDVLVTDNSGKLLYKSSTTLTKGVNEVKIDMETLPSGTYMVTLDNGSARVMKQIVK